MSPLHTSIVRAAACSEGCSLAPMPYNRFKVHHPSARVHCTNEQSCISRIDYVAVLLSMLCEHVLLIDDHAY